MPPAPPWACPSFLACGASQPIEENCAAARALDLAAAALVEISSHLLQIQHGQSRTYPQYVPFLSDNISAGQSMLAVLMFAKVVLSIEIWILVRWVKDL